MSKQSTSTIIAYINTRFADNTSGDISEKDIRDTFQELVDSLIHIDDGKKYLPFTNYTESVTYPPGWYAINQGQIVVSNKSTTGVYKTADWDTIFNPVPVNLDISGAADIDLETVKDNQVIILTSSNAGEVINAINNGRSDMEYLIYAENGLSVQFDFTTKAGAAAIRMISDVASFTLVGDGITGDWIRLNKRTAASAYYETGRKNYI